MIEITKNEDNTCSFHLKTDKGITLLNSVSFPNEKEITETIAQLGFLVKHHTVFERRTNHTGKFHFNLKDRNGNIIGNSETYSSEAGMENGIKNLKNRIASLSQAGHLL